MADSRAECQEEEKDEWESQKHDSKRQGLDLQNPVVEEEEEEEEFEEGFDIGEDRSDVSTLKDKYKADPEVDEKVKEQLDRHLDQVKKSMGFDIDVDVHLPRYYSWAYPVPLEDPEFQKDVEKIRKSMEAALEEYKKRKGRELEVIELVKANMVDTSNNLGELYFITFKAKNKHGSLFVFEDVGYVVLRGYQKIFSIWLGLCIWWFVEAASMWPLTDLSARAFVYGLDELVCLSLVVSLLQMLFVQKL